ncbi:hypothetical protein GGI25_005103 [Coemansia spiralis]|uniref:SURF6-domain-containing protein n=2 Tax=Coemansia TaxID=4863 RepID=A0A9W8KUZ8_9FUNG|nr:surfeit locus protein 6-domain-containing protein [Coemansia spiralis]KAJ1988915.1 hypothetical protein EDC05_005010 [Coemansia umbellata]KAJ2620016.1 hypothetical protein GGI26_005365 [Coemansia sp. RSA 1358]KAJ2672500.1 hypothetical protein GGI25_005103 [Coemansia spiralis]
MEQPDIDMLKASLKKHAQAFDDLLRLIPPKFYLPEEHEQILNNRYMKNTKKDTDAKQKDAQRKARASAKAARLDPDNNKTVQDLQAVKLEKQNASKEDSKRATTNGAAPHTNGTAKTGSDEDEWEDMEDEHELAEGAPGMSKMAIDLDGTGERLKQAPVDSVKPMPPAQSIDDLRARLHARIETLRQKRKAPEDDASREALLEKRMKRRKNTKEAQAKAKKAAGGTANEQVLGRNTPSAGSSSTTNGANAAGSVKDNLFYGKLTTGTPKKKKSLQIKQQLANIEGKKKELEELRMVDAEKADKLEAKDKWNKALTQAKGEKVKDDVRLLRKTVRREEQKKKKSSREWTERKSAVATKIKERADKREANIKARIDAKKMKKQGKSKKSIERALKGPKATSASKKKGPAQKARPGFEGKATKK